MLWQNIDYVGSVVLFCIGLYCVITKNNLIKKFIGLNIMETSVFAFIIALGVVDGGEAPIMGAGASAPFTNPIPQALILTGIVVAVSTTALALSLIIRIYEHCGTIEADELREME
ncbi:MAG: cation:proton antiporter [Actinobacteria bacterium HGW-Actinobacteria-6]|nr:MAG: cation:proton antiporter [Deltaproteobacteria bacterium HGW-Deltaproteobacteria-20]PKQ20352.1 MAG: cation:proton antiporter [Actinobacteria bacterium HGW-Actinobacteria-6]